MRRGCDLRSPCPATPKAQSTTSNGGKTDGLPHCTEGSARPAPLFPFAESRVRRRPGRAGAALLEGREREGRVAREELEREAEPSGAARVGRVELSLGDDLDVARVAQLQRGQEHAAHLVRVLALRQLREGDGLLDGAFGPLARRLSAPLGGVKVGEEAAGVLCDVERPPRLLLLQGGLDAGLPLADSAQQLEILRVGAAGLQARLDVLAADLLVRGCGERRRGRRRAALLRKGRLRSPPAGVLTVGGLVVVVVVEAERRHVVVVVSVRVAGEGGVGGGLVGGARPCGGHRVRLDLDLVRLGVGGEVPSLRDELPPLPPRRCSPLRLERVQRVELLP
mmetsp:Transcript_35512/g.114158  ORF Transcript_35512/g.114158 Transcript_35512/m.114158 type:complete len:337 (-) Transcript_35512:632-1642(-)